MLKKYLYIILLFYFYTIHAQTFKICNLYKAQGEQGALNTIVDKNGNRYTTVIYDTDFIIDSAGTQITIHNNYNNAAGLTNNAIAIIKYDASGNYLFHCAINTPSIIYNSDILIDMDDNNNLIFAYTIIGQINPSQVLDSIDLIDSKKILYKRIYTPVNHDRTGIIVSKIDSNGYFLWANSITRWRHSPSDSLPNWWLNSSGGGLNRECISITHNAANDVFINLDLYELQTPYYDTLTITYSTGATIPIYIKQKVIMIKFSASGSLSYYIEPYTLKVYNTANYTKTLRSVSDGINKYTLVRLTTPSTDTLIAPVLLPLDTGTNLVLIKTDNNDSIVWVKLIGRDTGYFALSYINSPYVMCFNNSTQELALGFSFSPNSFKFSQPLNTASASILIARLTALGTYIHYSAYGYAQILNSLSYNPLTNDLIAIGEYAGYLSIGKYYLQNFTYDYRYFIAYFNSLDSCIGAKLIDITGIGSGGNVSYNGFQGFGNQLTDKYGRTYLSGSFYKMINLPCQIDSNFQNIDGFVLTIEPPSNPIDTGVCYSMLSPSGKYIWDSSYIYFDTLANSLGCDSLLLFRLKVLQTKSKLDSTVCKSMLSFSKKYTYTTSGKYIDTISNTNHCDSIITLNLTVLGSNFDSITTSFCKSYLSPSGKYRYTNSGKYFDTLTNSKGCDSIIILNLTLLGSTFDSIAASFCKNYLSPSGKYIYTNSVRYFDTLTNIKGCDSIIIINLFSNKTTDSISVNVCDTFKSPSGKYRYSKSGIFTDTIQNTKNCDSIITINLTVSKPKVKATKSNDIDCTNKLINLLAEGAKTYVWNPITALSNFQISNPIATPSSKITYSVIGTDSNGCKNIDSVTINVTLSSSHQSIANVFTPNGDGINECFSIDSPSTIKSLTFYVFNRWGTQVFFTTNPEGCWDGKNESSQAVSDGTYFYIIEGESNCGLQFKLRGTVEVLR